MEEVSGAARAMSGTTSALRAADQESPDLALLGMQQDCAAASAGIINRMVARYEHRRSIQHNALGWGGEG
jgi:hypothetical protein